MTGIGLAKLMGSVDLWQRNRNAVDQRDVVGFDVEATDGSIGTIEHATFEVGCRLRARRHGDRGFSAVR
jgi:hypothetical protein